MNSKVFKLKMNFCTSFLDLVIKLGPISDDTGLYEYSIVTDTNRGKLFVYARDVRTFYWRYKHEVLQFCRENGFTEYYNWPRETPQPYGH